MIVYFLHYDGNDFRQEPIYTGPGRSFYDDSTMFTEGNTVLVEGDTLRWMGPFGIKKKGVVIAADDKTAFVQPISEGECWLDKVGEAWEKEGIDAGCIFEFSLRLNEKAIAGGLIRSSAAPGNVPLLHEVEKVAVRLIGSSIDDVTILGGGNPLFVSRWLEIQQQLA